MKALVVEDDPDTRSLLAEYLAMRGHEVTAVPDAEEGWDASQATDYPLVILDWALPGMDGLELCRRLRARPAGDESVILLVTGRVGPETLATVLDAGANDFLPKPFTPAMFEVRLGIAERQVSDIKARKHLVNELAHKALHDALTDLPNRSFLENRLDEAVAFGSATETHLAVLILDLDNFKEVNDTFGHAQGDLLLKDVAARLRGLLRASDTVARLGGDEFVVLLPETDVVGAMTVATKIIEALAVPFTIEEHAASIRASIGIAVYPEDGQGPEALVRRADAAMYRAKRSGVGFTLAADWDRPSEDDRRTA